ncbi:MAG: hypothetical protein IJ746_06780 [Ruminococcus sp.]|nr:hypothetical protein [Ruminococcus sp.]
MEMRESYRGYNDAMPQEIFIIVLTVLGALGFGYAEGFTKNPTRAGIQFFITIIYLFLTIAALLTTKMKSSLEADGTKVTFLRPFHPTVTIYYRDIDEIRVYTEFKRIKRHRFGSKRFYVETIVFRTVDDEEFRFSNVMDIHPDLRMEALGLMDKMLEMGKFKVLQRFIEANEVY